MLWVQKNKEQYKKMNEIEAKRKGTCKYCGKKVNRLQAVNDFHWTCHNSYLKGVEMARKEILNYLEGLSLSPVDWDDCGRDIENKIKELKQSLEENK